ncbi:MAG: enoyl-CoA hydratase/isomerase family protein [Actinobacteria bacterium]|nr:enoyl-CoA hydratase/isomerase family protein [Actinomycetota bacterium]
MADYVRLDVDKETGVGTIRLDRPPMNAIDGEVVEQLEAAAREATFNDDVRAVVIYGGDKIFAAGADIKEMAQRSPQEMMNRMGGLQAVFSQVEEIPKVVVAAITGYALGGGCELALTADFRVISETAKIGQPEILLGIIPGAGGTQRLPRLVGPARAKDIIYSGRFLGAEEALSIGLVDVVTDPGDVYAKACDIAARYAKGPLVALRAAKIAINRGLQVDMSNGLAIEREVFVGLFSTEDQKIGMSSFIEKGPGKAEFVGR